MKVHHAAKRKLRERIHEKAREERQRTKNRVKRRKKKGWLVMFEANRISFLQQRNNKQSIGLNEVIFEVIE